MKKEKTKFSTALIGVLLLAIIGVFREEIMLTLGYTPIENQNYNINEIPEYKGESFVTINNNEPNFKENELSTKSYEKYGELDELGRCTYAIANIGKDLMPTEERGSIGMIKPTGWHTVKYDVVDGKYLYNRCHLIGYQLTGENANPNNLITCTRQMNTKGMLDFENEVAEYIKETSNHVLYKVTPIYDGDNLIATGVQIEAYSVEDEGEGIKFNVFVYNVQDKIEIDYKTGESKLK
ncbi:MAG: DNA/RNA non-specific endonuclease [Bacilli bacterium]|nr:DNA/RNA non-specific endonuclease [Bacilli bacterium]